MKYKIVYKFNDQLKETIYIPEVDFRQKEITDIAYDALMLSLDF